MMTNGGEQVLICPYNKAHSIIKSRMQFHLAKCRQQQKNPEMATCPFNSTHIIPKIELSLHQLVCENRYVIDSFMFNVGNSNCPVEEVPVDVPPEDLAPCEENWDEDPAVSVLDTVKQNVKDKGVLLNLIGAPKAERKAHRLQERLRFQRVTDAQTEKKNDRESDSAKDKEVSNASALTSDIEVKQEAQAVSLPSSGECSPLNDVDISSTSSEALLYADDFTLVTRHKKTQGRKVKSHKQKQHEPHQREQHLSTNEVVDQMSKLKLENNKNDKSKSNNYARKLSSNTSSQNIGNNMASVVSPNRNYPAFLDLRNEEFPSLPVSGRGRMFGP